MIRRSILAILAALFLAAPALGYDPDAKPHIPINVDALHRQREFAFGFAMGTTPRIRFYTLWDGAAWTNLNNVTGTVYYSESITSGWSIGQSSTNWAITTNGRAFIDVDYAQTNTLVTNGNLWGQLILASPDMGILEWNHGSIEIDLSPGTAPSGVPPIPLDYLRRDGTLGMLAGLKMGTNPIVEMSWFRVEVGPGSPAFIFSNGVLYADDPGTYVGPLADFYNGYYYVNTNETGISLLARELVAGGGKVVAWSNDNFHVFVDGIPGGSNTVKWGSAARPFSEVHCADIFLSTSSIYMGGVKIGRFDPGSTSFIWEVNTLNTGQVVSVEKMIRTSTNVLFDDDEAVTFGKVADMLASAYGQILFGDTNDHPSLAGNSMVDINPATVWTSATVLAVGTNVLGPWYYTNQIDGSASAGVYNGHFYANAVGLGGAEISVIMRLIASDGTTTNVLGESFPIVLSSDIQAFDAPITMATSTFYSAGWYLGVEMLAIRDGGSSATVYLYGAGEYNTSLWTPSLSAAEFGWGSLVGDITAQTDVPILDVLKTEGEWTNALAWIGAFTNVSTAPFDGWAVVELRSYENHAFGGTPPGHTFAWRFATNTGYVADSYGSNSLFLAGGWPRHYSAAYEITEGAVYTNVFEIWLDDAGIGTKTSRFGNVVFTVDHGKDL